MVDLSQYAEVPETVTINLPPEEIAVREQERIERLKLEIELATARRDEALAQAYANGIRVYSGYKFSAAKPADSISEAKLAEKHPDIMDGYSEWYLQTREVKITKTDLKKYLKISRNTNPDQVLEDITTPGKGAPTYKMTKEKEVDA